MHNLASLCVLAYKRPERLHRCLESLHKTIDYPCEIIVNLDAEEDTHNISYLSAMFTDKRISKLILNNGKNRGVGRAFQNCLGVAEGDYIFKIDTDLTFHPQWLSKAVQLIETRPDIGALGLFDYNKWDQNDDRFKPEFNVVEDHGDYQIVKDFVSSIYGFKRNPGEYFPDIPDDGYHQTLGSLRGGLAIRHSMDNTAFGVGKSAYVVGTMDNPRKAETFTEPFIFPQKG